jgi:hypothetical protein
MPRTLFNVNCCVQMIIPSSAKSWNLRGGMILYPTYSFILTVCLHWTAYIIVLLEELHVMMYTSEL